MTLPAVRPCRPFLRPRGDGRQTCGVGYSAAFTGNLHGVEYYNIQGGATVSGAVPDPSTWAMLLLSFAGLGYAGYRQAKTSPPRSLPNSSDWLPSVTGMLDAPQRNDRAF